MKDRYLVIISTMKTYD